MNINSEEYARLKLLEENLWKSNFRFDMAQMDRVLAPDFFEFGRSGRIYRRTDTLDVKKQDIPCKFPLVNFEIRSIDADTVQITYISNVDYPEGKETSLRSSIWSRINKRWQLRFHQGTPLRNYYT